MTTPTIRNMIIRIPMVTVHLAPSPSSFYLHSERLVYSSLYALSCSSRGQSIGSHEHSLSAVPSISRRFDWAAVSSYLAALKLLLELPNASDLVSAAIC